MGSRDKLLSKPDQGIFGLTVIISVLLAVASSIGNTLPGLLWPVLQVLLWPALVGFWILSVMRLSAILDRKQRSEHEERIEALLERIAGDSAGK